jgi:ubiquinone/menaquinone biosynthesis C-methylase UbiE
LPLTIDAKSGPERMTAKAVQSYWTRRPCGSSLASDAKPGSAEFFQLTEMHRYTREPYVPAFARFDEWKGKKVLEVGCGIGADLARFARAGARVVGVDITAVGAVTSRRRLQFHNLPGETLVGNAESLPFASNFFDLVYSWGVIHHSPDTEAAAREIVRVARPGGSVVVMLYNRRSLVAAQAYILYGLLRGRPFRSLSEIMASHLESPGTKAFTEQQARRMFDVLENLHVRRVVTIYDLRIGRDRFLPNWICRILPQRLGYFMVISGTKPRLAAGSMPELNIAHARRSLKV